MAITSVIVFLFSLLSFIIVLTGIILFFTKKTHTSLSSKK